MPISVMKPKKLLVALLGSLFLILGNCSLVSDTYPEYKVDPLLGQNQDDMIYASGMSVDSNNNNPWWKWFMPNFYYDSASNTSSSTTEVLCHIRIMSYAKPAYTQYSPFGSGQLEDIGSFRSLTGIKCYYALNGYQDLRFAIYCPVWGGGGSHEIRSGAGGEVAAEDICRSLNQPQQISVRLFRPENSQHWQEAPAERKRSKLKLIAPHPASNVRTTFLAIPKTPADKQALSVTVREEESRRFPSLGQFRLTRDPTLRIVTTIQVFRNRMSGPMMCLFIHHYARLGFRVVIYDMFGWHYDFVKDLLLSSSTVYDIVYHPYTVLQLLRPDYFSYEYAENQTVEYKAYYNRDVNSQKDAIPVISNTEFLDADKQLTFDSARLEFRYCDVMLVADIDELLYTPLDPPGKMKQVVRDFFTSARHMTHENWWFSRSAVGGAVPSGVIEYSENSDKAVITRIENCVIQGYSNKNYAEMMDCFKGPPIPQKHVKFADVLAVCPFSWNHFSCMEYNRKKYKWTAELVARHQIAINRPWCFCENKKLTTARIKMLHVSHIGYMRAMFVAHSHSIKMGENITYKQERNPLVDTF